MRLHQIYMYIFICVCVCIHYNMDESRGYYAKGNRSKTNTISLICDFKKPKQRKQWKHSYGEQTVGFQKDGS